MKDEKFLEELINSYSPSGFENDTQQKWIDYVHNSTDKFDIDNYGNVVATLISDNEDKYWETFKIAVSAHVDEVSYRISYITDKGIISVIKNGNSDHQIAPGSRVKIHTSKGIVDGVFGWPSVNTRVREGKETSPTIDNIFIDCGIESRKELETLGVRVGCPVTYPANFQKLGKYYTGKSFDNKIGGYIISQICKNIYDEQVKHESEILFINTVQEEVGLKGSQMIVNKYKPHVVITIDATHDTNTPMMNKKKLGDIACGRGPVITISPTTHQKLVLLIEEIAQENKIPYQIKALSKTNTDTESYMTNGIVSGLVSVPLKYMHSKVEMAHVDDVSNTILLLRKVIETMKPGTDFTFLKTN